MILKKYITIALLACAITLAGCSEGRNQQTGQNAETEIRQDRVADQQGQAALYNYHRDTTMPAADPMTYPYAVTDEYVDSLRPSGGDQGQTLAQEREAFLDSLETRAENLRKQARLRETEQEWLESIDTRIQLVAEMTETLDQEIQQLDQQLENLNEVAELEETLDDTVYNR